MKRRAWFLMELPLRTGDVFDVMLPASAKPLGIHIDHEQKRILTRGGGPLEPVVKLALEVPVVQEERIPRRFICVPEKTPFEVEDYDFVCVFANPVTNQRLALFEVNVPAPAMDSTKPAEAEATP